MNHLLEQENAAPKGKDNSLWDAERCGEGRSRFGGRIPVLETRFCLLGAH